jgi:hypothetical protein
LEAAKYGLEAARDDSGTPDAALPDLFGSESVSSAGPAFRAVKDKYKSGRDDGFRAPPSSSHFYTGMEAPSGVVQRRCRSSAVKWESMSSASRCSRAANATISFVARAVFLAASVVTAPVTLRHFEKNVSIRCRNVAHQIAEREFVWAESPIDLTGWNSPDEIHRALMDFSEMPQKLLRGHEFPCLSSSFRKSAKSVPDMVAIGRSSPFVTLLFQIFGCRSSSSESAKPPAYNVPFGC